MTSIRPLASADLTPLLSIAAASREAAQWTRAAYEQFLNKEYPAACLVAEREGAVVGFICCRVTADEAEVLNLAVLPSSRRLGAASSLLAEAIRQSLARGARRMFLEVRETNQPAIGFYERHGFRLSSRRRAYYADPPADALVLARDLTLEKPST